MIYDIDGNIISTAYDINGDQLTQCYDIDGNPLLSGESLKVMTYNVGRFTNFNSQQAMQNAIITNNEPDIIGMQELGSGSISSVGTNMLSDYAVKQLSNHNNKILMVSKTIQLSNLVIADFVHQDPKDEQLYGETRAYMKADIDVNGKNVTWINSHLAFNTKSVQYEQMGEIFTMAEQCDRVIITADFNSGDINASSDDYIYMYKQFVDAGYNLANCSPSAGFTKTYTGLTSASSLADFEKCTDSIIVSGNIAINQVIFDTTKLSYQNGQSIDHIPVVAKLIIY